jgi:small subunit ribosomal protein S1
LTTTDEAPVTDAIAEAPSTEEMPVLESMEDLLAGESASLPSIGRGDVIEGMVVRIEPDEILVDIGLKAEGYVPEREQWDNRLDEPRPDYQVGEKILVYVVQPEGDGRAMLSFRRAAQEKVWRATEELFETGEIIEATILEYNKGGVLVDVGPRGFVPLSQLTSLRRGASDETEDELAARLAELVSRSINVKIIELDRRRNRLILSERVAEREVRSRRREVLLDELQVGQVRKGVVSNICSFGAFIDLGGADGLAHISELSWSRVESPEEILTPGEEIDVYVLSLDREDKKIALSVRRATKDPWESLESRYSVEEIVEGEITKLAPFGAFVRLTDGIEGLAHASDLGDAALDSMNEGDHGKFNILSIDSGRRRIRLSPISIESGKGQETESTDEAEDTPAEETPTAVAEVSDGDEPPADPDAEVDIATDGVLATPETTDNASDEPDASSTLLAEAADDGATIEAEDKPDG